MIFLYIVHTQTQLPHIIYGLQPHPEVVFFLSGSLPTSSNQVSQSGKGGPVIIELPLNQIRRPLMRTRANDPQKVQELMDSIAQIGLQVPVSSHFHSIFFISI